MQAEHLSVWIPGRPVPQGSATIQRFSTAHRGQVVSSNKARLLPWRGCIAALVAEAWGDRPPLDMPVAVALSFRFARPKSHFGTGRNAGIVKSTADPAPMTRGQGDVDKLARAVLDGLSDGGAISDDSRVVDLHARKVWAHDGKEGVWIDLRLDHQPPATLKQRRRTVAV